MLFPTLGNPTSPTSAMTFISRISVCGSVFAPVAAGSREAHVALAPSSALQKADLFAVVVHVADDFPALGVAHERAARHFDENVLSALAEALVRAAALAVPREIFARIAERKKIVHVLVRRDIDGAAVAAVAAVRSAGGFSLIRFEGIHSVAAVARLYGDFDFIGKHLVIHSQSIAIFQKKGNAFAPPRSFSANFAPFCENYRNDVTNALVCGIIMIRTSPRTRAV